MKEEIEGQNKCGTVLKDRIEGTEMNRVEGQSLGIELRDRVEGQNLETKLRDRNEEQKGMEKKQSELNNLRNEIKFQPHEQRTVDDQTTQGQELGEVL